MAKGPLFIEWKNFSQLIEAVPNSSGETYQDARTIYGDMSRLVVSWIANCQSSELEALYAAYGWGGSPNVRAMQECARHWLQT